MLREYILLLIRILDDQSQRIDSAVFRLRSASREQTDTAEKAVTDRIAECESLQDQVRVFRGVWRDHMASLPQYGCQDEAPARWADRAMNENAKIKIQEARRRMDEIKVAEREIGAKRDRAAQGKEPHGRAPHGHVIILQLYGHETRSKGKERHEQQGMEKV